MWRKGLMMGLLRRPFKAGGAPSAPGPPSGRLGGAVAAAAPPSQRGLGLGATPSARTAATSRALKARVRSRLIAELGPDVDLSRTIQVRQRIKALFDPVVEHEDIV